MVEKVFNVWRPQVWLDLRQSASAGRAEPNATRYALTYQKDRVNLDRREVARHGLFQPI
jgi:hypothetical protein